MSFPTIAKSLPYNITPFPLVTNLPSPKLTPRTSLASSTSTILSDGSIASTTSVLTIDTEITVPEAFAPVNETRVLPSNFAIPPPYSASHHNTSIPPRYNPLAPHPYVVEDPCYSHVYPMGPFVRPVNLFPRPYILGPGPPLPIAQHPHLHCMPLAAPPKMRPTRYHSQSFHPPAPRFEPVIVNTAIKFSQAPEIISIISVSTSNIHSVTKCADTNGARFRMCEVPKLVIQRCARRRIPHDSSTLHIAHSGSPRMRYPPLEWCHWKRKVV